MPRMASGGIGKACFYAAGGAKSAAQFTDNSAPTVVRSGTAATSTCFRACKRPAPEFHPPRGLLTTAASQLPQVVDNG